MSETPLSYLTRTMMQEDKIWGSEVEIFAISAILEIDIYVAVECDNCKESSYNIHQQRIIRWYRYNASNNFDKSFAIYFAIYSSYEPVTTLINSLLPHICEFIRRLLFHAIFTSMLLSPKPWMFSIYATFTQCEIMRLLFL